MANTLPLENEKTLAAAVAAGNKINRIFGGSSFDSLIASATSFSDLVADLYANLLSGTIPLYDKETTIVLRYFEQGLKLLNLLGKLTNSQVTSATDWDAASADTSLRYLFTQHIGLNGFSVADESYIDGVFSQGVSA